MSLLTCRKIAVLKFTVFVLHEEKPKGVGAHFTSSEKASSVPGRMHTAVVESSGAANPRVPVLKLTVLSLSPTLAGRDLTWWRLKSQMGRGTPQRSRSPRPFLLAEPAQNSNRARHCEPLRGGDKPADLPVQQPTKFSASVVCSGTIGRSTLSVLAAGPDRGYGNADATVVLILLHGARLQSRLVLCPLFGDAQQVKYVALEPLGATEGASHDVAYHSRQAEAGNVGFV
jgi:hypothetical protein